MLQSLRVNLLLSMKSPAQTPQCQAVKSISDCLARDIHTNVLHALKMLGETANLAIVHNDVSSWRSWTLTLTLYRVSSRATSSHTDTSQTKTMIRKDEVGKYAYKTILLFGHFLIVASLVPL